MKTIRYHNPGEEWLHGIQDFDTMGSCLGTPKISKEALNVDLNKDGVIQKTEMAKFIARNEKLYMMLAVNLQLPVEKCQEIATNVAFQMSKRSDPNSSLRDLSEATKQREPTLEEFDAFLTFLEQPTGQQEFFHRTVFATFDVDGSGYVEPHELDNFLNIFYAAGSIFAGDARLPKQSKLKKEVMRQLDTNRDGKLEFNELRTLISGGARAGLSFDETDDDELDSDEEKLKKKVSSSREPSRPKSNRSTKSSSSSKHKHRSKSPCKEMARSKSSSNGETRSSSSGKEKSPRSSSRKTDETSSSGGTGGGSGSRSRSATSTSKPKSASEGLGDSRSRRHTERTTGKRSG